MPFLWALQSAWFVTALWGSMFCQGTQVTETHSTGISLGPLHRKMSSSVCIASGSPKMPSYSPMQLPAALQHSDASSLSARPASFATCPHWLEKSPVGGALDIMASFLLVFDNYIHEERLPLLRLWRGSMLSPWFWPKKLSPSSLGNNIYGEAVSSLGFPGRMMSREA